MKQLIEELLEQARKENDGHYAYYFRKILMPLFPHINDNTSEEEALTLLKQIYKKESDYYKSQEQILALFKCVYKEIEDAIIHRALEKSVAAEEAQPEGANADPSLAFSNETSPTSELAVEDLAVTGLTLEQLTE